MVDRPVYVLDANVFIQAARRYYAFDLAPKFWQSLIRHAANGVVESIDGVKKELDKGKDALAQWADSHFGGAFRPTDEEDIFESYRRVITWVQGQSQFNDAAKAEFAAGADGWLVAYAMAKGRVLVTHELLDPHVKRKVPIPNVCQSFQVSFLDTFEMLRRLGVQFT